MKINATSCFPSKTATNPRKPNTIPEVVKPCTAQATAFCLALGFVLLFSILEIDIQNK